VTAAVLLHRRARREAGIDVLHLLPGTVLEMPDGRRLIVQANGALDPIRVGGSPVAGIAADPTAGRAP
jgi:hypothetical protein